MEIFNQAADPLAFKGLADSSSKTARGHAIAIGNFDGVHLGHQRLLRRTIELAAQQGSCPSALVFWPSPREFFQSKGSQPPVADDNIFTLQQKLAALREVGVARTFIKVFDDDIAEWTPEFFVRVFLRQALGARAAVVGDNFRFGRQRSGGGDELRHLGEAAGLKVLIAGLESFGADAENISSSAVRRLLAGGEMREAVRRLGHPFTIQGRTVQGDRLGRQIGFPTLNLTPDAAQIRPRDGVYWGHVWLAEFAPAAGPPQEATATVMTIPASAKRAVFSLGSRPSAGLSPEYRLEAHVLDWMPAVGKDHYGLPATFYLSGFLRGQSKFASLLQLKEAIAKDILAWGAGA